MTQTSDVSAEPVSISRRRRMFRRLAVVLGLLALLITGEEVAFRVLVPDVHSQGHNAMWTRHQWVGERHSEAEYVALANKLARLKISDVYQHVGPMQSDGSVKASRIKFAAEYVKAMKRLAPRVRLQAWLGQMEAKAGGPLDLGRAETRSGVVTTARRFLDMGFDGIHIDIEPIYSGDSNFLTLMKDLHQLTKSRGALLSVSACHPEPVAGMERAARLVAKCPGYWTRSYFLKVAKEVDQVAVMSYDMAAPLPGFYGRTVAWTVGWCVDNGVDDLLIGIPTYDSTSLAHQAWIENVSNAVIGLKQGVARLNANDRKKVGAAVFAEWTTSEDEEKVLREEWL